MPIAPPFWETTALEDMTHAQWESLCDGCGRCCLVVVEDEDTGEYVRLAVSCRLLDTDSCRCTDYKNRRKRVPSCVRVTPDVARTAAWLPPTCAYRRLALGQPLDWWHPLVSGDPQTVHRAGISVAGRVISEEFVDEDEALDYPLDP